MRKYKVKSEMNSCGDIGYVIMKRMLGVFWVHLNHRETLYSNYHMVYTSYEEAKAVCDRLEETK